jgi:hypothetical protein
MARAGASTSGAMVFPVPPEATNSGARRKAHSTTRPVDEVPMR